MGGIIAQRRWRARMAGSLLCCMMLGTVPARESGAGLGIGVLEMCRPECRWLGGPLVLSWGCRLGFR